MNMVNTYDDSAPKLSGFARVDRLNKMLILSHLFTMISVRLNKPRKIMTNLIRNAMIISYLSCLLAKKPEADQLVMCYINFNKQISKFFLWD